MSRTNPNPLSRTRMDEGRLMQVLVAPIVSEKATHVADKSNAVTFKVLQDATKPEIKADIENLFKVKVLAVNTIVRKGKVKHFRGVKGRQQDVKEAIVRLAEGDKIDVTTSI